MKKNHYFFALALPHEVKHELRKLAASINGPFSFEKWVHHEDYHITLAFLGSADSLQLQEAVQRVNLAVEDCSTFSIQIHQTGVFGRREAPRILWAGVEPSPNLNSLQRLVHNCCTEVGFQLDKRPFTPHITLARKWNEQHAFLINELFRFTDHHFSGIEFIATDVVLFQTHLERSPKYEKIETFKLKA